MPRPLLPLLACLAALAAGCAEGRVPELRNLNPWVRKQWADDEAVTTTYHKKVADLTALRSQASRLPPEQVEQVAAQLAGRLHEEKAPVLRAELVRTLGALPSPTARAAVTTAIADEVAAVRIAACQAL